MSSLSYIAIVRVLTKKCLIYGLVWFGMVWLGMVWFGLVWFGLVWYGLVWFGLVWYGLVWYGMVWFETTSIQSYSENFIQVQLVLTDLGKIYI